MLSGVDGYVVIEEVISKYKKLTEINSDLTYENYKNNSMVKKIDASRSADDEATIYFVYNAKSVKTLLLFTPSERIVNIVKKLYPKKEFK